MAVDCFEDLVKMGWKRRIGKPGYTRPSGRVVIRRNQLSEEEKSELGDILFPGHRARIITTQPGAIHTLPMTEPLPPTDSPLPSSSGFITDPELPSVSTSSCDSQIQSSSSHSSITEVLSELQPTTTLEVEL